MGEISQIQVLLWSFLVHVLHGGVIISVKMDADKKIEEQKAARSKAEEEVEKLKHQVANLQSELEQLQEHLRMIEEEKFWRRH